MARLRLQFALKTLIVLAMVFGTLIGLWGTRVKTRRERERMEIQKIREQFEEFEDCWDSEQPDQLTPPRREAGTIGP